MKSISTNNFKCIVTYFMPVVYYNLIHDWTRCEKTLFVILFLSYIFIKLVNFKVFFSKLFFFSIITAFVETVKYQPVDVLLEEIHVNNSRRIRN